MRSSRPSLRDRRGLVLAALVILTAPLAADTTVLGAGYRLGLARD